MRHQDRYSHSKDRVKHEIGFVRSKSIDRYIGKRARPSRALKNELRINDTVSVDKRQTTWQFLMVFLLGATFSSLTADPLSDFLFFLRNSQGTPLSPAEQVFYWYYLPGLVYAGMFGIAVLLMYFTKTSPNNYKYAIIAFAGLSFAFSLWILGFDPLVIILLIIPFILIVFILIYKTVIKAKGEKIEL